MSGFMRGIVPGNKNHRVILLLGTGLPSRLHTKEEDSIVEEGVLSGFELSFAVINDYEVLKLA